MSREKRIIALGFFDGVHRGHQALLRQCQEISNQIQGKTGAITFEQHPMSLFSSQIPKLVSTLADRQRLLHQYGMEQVISYPVTKEVMSTDWWDFLTDLVEQGAAGFVCGDDFRFGHRGAGDSEKLTQFCRERGLPCVIVPEQKLEGVRISSTHIRSLIEAGRMEEAVEFLGHPHTLTGQVVPGRHLGHKLGFPTANVLIPEQVVCPMHGVYACQAVIGHRRYPAVTNVGNRPTVQGHQVRTESWILGFDGDLYGQNITLEFYSFLRREEKFPSLEALIRAVQADGARTLDYFNAKLG